VGAEHRAARSFREEGFLESVARALPAAGAAGWLRERLRPMFRRLVARNPRALCATLPGGETFIVSPDYRHVTWNPEEYEAFRAEVRPGDVILDVGANVGAYSVLFGRWAGEHGRVFAFEPEPRAFAGLTCHLELNGMAGYVRAVCAAVTDGSVDCVRLATAPSSGLARVTAKDAEVPDAIEVAATSIDLFCEENGLSPRVIKIDVEGAELQALRGARRTIAARGASLVLFVEMHPAIWASSGLSADDLAGEIAAQGLVPERLDGAARDLWTTEGVCLRLRPRSRA
jgi:FkbM family methyltransferase